MNAKLPDDDFPASGRLAAVDYGTVRMGLAVCDPDRTLASPIEVHQVQGPKKDAQYFARIAKEERLVGWVVGLPVHCDGGESQKSRESREFARWLSEETGLPVRLFDERFSTAAAKERLVSAGIGRRKKKQQLDAVAALVVLESFLEACHYRGEIVGQTIHQATNGDQPLDGDSASSEPHQ